MSIWLRVLCLLAVVTMGSTAQSITIPHQFTPRPYQERLCRALSCGYKRGVAVWHRRAGKDKTFINIMAAAAVARKGTYFYFFPTYNQGRKILWDGMDKTGFKFTDHIPLSLRSTTNSTEMKITLKTGSIVQIVGTDNYDSIMGTNPLGCIFSEYSLQDPAAWDYVRPILAENGGWALFNFTPRGQNHAYDLFQMAQENPQWFCELLTVNDTNAITQEAIEEERKAGMKEPMIRQEFYCSFETGIPGAIFEDEIMAMYSQKRVTRVPVEPGIPVDVFQDLGFADNNCLWLGQVINRELRFVDYYEDQFKKTSHYINWLKDWRGQHGASIGTIVLPHDGAHQSRHGLSDQEEYEQAGFDVVVVQRPQVIRDKHEATRRLFPRVWIDERKCSKGLNCLKNYRREFKDKYDIFSDRPVHDWASHGANGFMTAAMWDKLQMPEQAGASNIYTGAGMHSGGSNSWMGR